MGQELQLLTPDLLQLDTEISTNVIPLAEPSPAPTLQREDTLISSVTADAGSIGSDEDHNKAEPKKEDKPAVTRAMREVMLREMRVDMERYAWKRERDFGGEHGYCLHPPIGSETGEVDDDTDREEGSTEELPLRSFPLDNRRRTRRGAASVGRSGRDQRGQNNRAGDPAWFQNSIRAFSEHLARRRTEESQRPAGNDRDAISGSVPTTGATAGGDDATSENARSQVEDEVLYYLTYSSLPRDDRILLLYAGLDGIDWREGCDFIWRWNDFLAEWSPPFADRPDEVPQRVRILWHALSEGLGDWTPSDSVIEEVGYFLDELTVAAQGQTQIADPATSNIVLSDRADGAVVALFYTSVLLGFFESMNNGEQLPTEGSLEAQTLTPLLEPLGELNLPLEERGIFLGALDQGILFSRLERILENWNAVVGRVRDIGSPI